MKRRIPTPVVFLAAVVVYVLGIELSSGALLLLGAALEVWCLVRVGRRGGRRR
ncbi:hypothetical protein [Rubrivivax gelatinosus]|uniref:Transmembrane protein n=1 Tax=Rubrivivax gelatinosus TaxID=28068 RepID=A0A4R2MPM0_RUBGE|nr:hypothetical protein [Rubrivivax gelatinosus]TCP01293.1 hypothetical protein EV684_110225 [Rubrivivax gelatinosus]